MVDNSDALLQGGCRCGSIRFYCTSLPKSVIFCHCSTCRKLSGAPFQALASLPSSSVIFTSKDTLTSVSHTSFATRAHCSACGTPIYLAQHCEPELLSVVAGAIDEDTIKDGGRESMRPVKHIFLKEKAAWYDLPDDGLLRYEGFSDPSFQEKRQELKE
jgi:hypothetical protein